MKKAQSSMEFFVYVGLAFLIVIMVVGFVTLQIRDIRDQREFLLVQDVALMLQKEITIAASVEDGYEREFVTPVKLQNTIPYDIVIVNTTVTINSSKTVFTVAIPSITGTVNKGQNAIEKKNGVVSLNS